MFAHAQVQKPSSRALRLGVWLAITALIAVALLASTARGQTVLAATNLNQSTPISSGAVAYQGDADECDALDLDPGEVVWHFVLTGTSAGTSTVLHAVFSSGTIDQAATTKTGNTLHWYISTGATTLLSASTTANGNRLNLSHICSGGESSSSSDSSSTGSSS